MPAAQEHLFTEFTQARSLREKRTGESGGSVQYRQLGRTGFRVSTVGYGTWGVGGKQWTGGRDEDSLAAMRRAIELDLNFFDTALAYGDGHAERLLANVLAGSDSQVLVATKVPPKNRVWPAKRGTRIDEVFPFDHIVRSTEASLRNLKLDTIDLQQLHVWNPEWLTQDAWCRAFEHLKSEGKVRSVGISINDHDPNSALQVVRSGLIDSIQVIYNIFEQSPETQLLPACLENNVGVIARVPFDEGALAGSIGARTAFPQSDFRNRYFRGDRKRQVAVRIEAIRRELGDIDLAGTALRYCLSHPAISTVIAGMRSCRHVEANIGAGRLGPLPVDKMELLRGHAWPKNFYQ